MIVVCLELLAGCTMTRKPTTHATARTDVTSYVPATFDEVADGPALVAIELKETFSGDIEGEGVARVIQATRKGGTTTFVTIERVRGAITGRKGTFLLQVSGSVIDKEMHAEWSVVKGSGTGQLAGLRGDGGFTARLGQHGSVWLDYSLG
jgi:hypothetical protein